MPGILDRFGAAEETPDPGINNPTVEPQPGGLLTRFSRPPKNKTVTEDGTPAPLPEPAEKQLPKGAIDWDVNGNPFFGEGISGIVKKWAWNYSKDVKDVTDDDWKDLKDRWSASMEKTTTNTKDRLGVELEQIGMMAEGFSKAWQSGESEDSLLSPVLKATGATVTAVGELFSIPAQKIEQAAGALGGFREAATEIDSPLPRLDGWAQNILYAMPPVGLAYDAARIALSPSENKWTKTQQKIEEGWESGRIFYSTLFDETLKEKFLAEYREGADPTLLAMKLQNPWAEMGGQLLLDPLNLIGAFGKAAKTAKELSAADAATTASGLLKLESGKAALKAMQEAADDISGARALDDLVKAQAEAVQAVQKSSKILNVRYAADALTTSSRQNAIVARGKDRLGNMALILKESGMSYDGIAEAVLDGVRSVAGNAEEARRGLNGVAKLPNANLWLGDDYIEIFSVLNKMMSSADGVIDGGRLRKLMNVADPATFADEATKLMRSAASDGFPDVNQMAEASKLLKQAKRTGGTISDETRALGEQYDNLPAHVKYLNRVDSTFSKYVRNPINSVLGLAYFNLQGGVAVRNIITNQELILIDKGVGAFFKDGKYWKTENVVDYVKDIYGELPTSAKGFESLAQATTDRSPILFGKWMEKGEEAAAVRIVGAAIRDTFDKMIPKAFPSLAREIQAGTITDKQANKLLSLIKRNNGNLERAFKEFREFYKVGNVEDWRNLDFVTDYERKALESMDMWKDIEDLAQNGAATQADVEKVFENLRTVIDERAAMAADDVAGLSVDHPGAESWAEIMRAVEQGHLDPTQQHVFTALMESAEQVRLEYQSLLDDVANKAVQALHQEGRGQEAQRIAAEMNRVRDVIRRGGPATAKEAQEHTAEAWRWTEEIRGLKKPTPQELSSYWTRAGLAGDPPIDLNQKSLLKELWKQRFQKVQQIWNGALDAVIGESETVLSQMDGIVDTTELQAMSARTREITQKSQALRNSVYEGGKIIYRPKEDYLSMAHRYGIPTAAKSGKPNDGAILNIVNRYSDLPDETPIKATWKKSKGVYKTKVDGVDYEIASDGTLTKLGPGGERDVLGNYKNVDDAKTAFSSGKAGSKAKQSVTIEGDGYAGFEGGNPISILASRGGINAAEFGDVAGGVLGHDKKGVMPGLFQHQGSEGKGMGIDEAGRLLAEHGFISREQADDVNFVRDYIRKQMDSSGQGSKTFEEEIADPNAPFYDDEGKLQNVPKDWKYQSMDEIPMDVLKKALDNQRRAHGLDPIKDPGIAIPPPHPTGSQPTIQRAWNENSRGAKYTLDNIRNEIVARWGKTNAERKIDGNVENILASVRSTMEPRMSEMKAIALRIAKEQRDFTLLNYGEKTYGDIAKSYILPYHFFYTRQYKNWISRVASDPSLVSKYGTYKRNLESVNKDLPDWYKQQMNINPFANDPNMEGKTFLGIPADHPLFINLESTFNPMYGLTGTDYFDKTKRHNWATATIDDMGKFGPSMWAPIQLGIAALLFKDGETDVASRWASRLFPQTAQIKAVSSWLGKPVELDPAVNMFNGGIDAQERGRMAYAAAQLIESQQFTAEEVQLSFQQQSGEPWDLAYQMAVQSRSASSISSYFLGVGFKPRSANDVMVEEMYTDLNKLYAVSDMMAPEDYRKAWEQLRSQYPTGFVDTVLLSRKGGDKRDAALAYEVLNRIPPGNMSDALSTIGLSSDEIAKFYDSKGFTDPGIKFTKQEKDRFMAAVIDLATMLKIPDSATRAEWTDARTSYGAVYDGIEEEFGSDIWDKVSHWYDLKEDNKEAADMFAQQHPEIFAAQQAKRAAVISDPTLAAYYGGIETIETYIDGITRQKLSDEFGAEIYDIQTGYYNATNQRQYLGQHPELRTFWTRKRELEAQQESMFYEFANRLPEARGAQFQEGFEPESYTQEQLYNALQPQEQVPAWEEVSQGMAPWLQDEVMQYAQTGKPLSKRAQSQMDYLADVGNYYNAKELLRYAVLSMREPVGSSAPPASGGGLLSRFGP